MKKFRLFFVCLLVLAVFTACNMGGPAESTHVHDFNNILKQCPKDKVIDKDHVVAFIGESFEKATARFYSLDEAVKYLEAQQAKKAVEDLPSSCTIHTCVDEISCDGLTINNIDVAFDFASTVVTFTGNVGLVVNGGNVSVTGEELKAKTDSLE